MGRHTNFEQDDEAFPPDRRYKLDQYFAWVVLGWETQPDEDTEWTGIEPRTGKVVAYPVGDHTMREVFEEEELVPLEGGYCLECGQLGCSAMPSD